MREYWISILFFTMTMIFLDLHFNSYLECGDRFVPFPKYFSASKRNQFKWNSNAPYRFLIQSAILYPNRTPPFLSSRWLNIYSTTLSLSTGHKYRELSVDWTDRLNIGLCDKVIKQRPLASTQYKHLLNLL